jgi:hypothetical protein
MKNVSVENQNLLQVLTPGFMVKSVDSYRNELLCLLRDDSDVSVSKSGTSPTAQGWPTDNFNVT